MVIGLQRANILPAVTILEPQINREASQYIVDNYRRLLGIIRTYENLREDKAEELLQDLFISMVESEDNGEGFDMEYNNGDGTEVQLLSVEQFVLGRAKLYAKNVKYRSDIIDGYSTVITAEETFFESELDENGQEVLDKNGNIKKRKITQKVKKNVLITLNAATPNDDKSEVLNDEFQTAYNNAPVSDSQDDVAEMLSLRENIDYCIDVCELHDFNILNVFRNIDKLASMLGDFSKKKKSAESVFTKLSELVAENDEFGATLIEVLRFSEKDRMTFDGVLASYC